MRGLVVLASGLEWVLSRTNRSRDLVSYVVISSELLQLDGLW